METAFGFIRTNERESKPRKHGLTEIRGPYYSVPGLPGLADLLETWGEYVDSFKFSGGSFTLMPRTKLQATIELCHRHNVLVSTGGYIEHVLTQGPAVVDRYIKECREQGFDILELSAGFVTLGTADWLRLVEQVRKAGLRPKPEVGIQFGAGGASSGGELAAAGQRDAHWAIQQARRFVDAGAYMVMIESEGITENVSSWRTDIVFQIVEALGLEMLMFEAADPAVFSWYLRTYGTDINLFVDHSQIVQLETMRRGMWGPTQLWGRIVSYRGPATD